MTYELDGLSLKDLKKLEKDVVATIGSYETRAKAQALAELDVKARELGFSLAELTGAVVSSKGKRAPASPKHRHPENPSETWSGRGRKPAWFVAALENGADINILLV